MRNKRTVIAMVAALVIAAWGGVGPCWAEGDGTPPGGDITADIILRLFGLDVGLGYRGIVLVPGVQTTLWAYAGGGYETQHYYRDAAGNFMAPGSLSSGDPAAFWRIEGAWRLGIEQGLLWNERAQTNLLEAFVFYRGRYDVNQVGAGDLLFTSSLGDRETSLSNCLQAGIAYDDVLFNRANKTRGGIAAEASVEWGPAGFLNELVGGSDYVRFNGTFWGFLPLYDAAPGRSPNLFSVYLCDFTGVDYALGGQVPLYVSESLGGRDQRTGLGNIVRGMDSAAYNANLKAVSSLEVRANLPAIDLKTLWPALASALPFVDWSSLVPGLAAFYDAGYYSQVGEPGTDGAAAFIDSTGAGVYINLFDLAQVAAYVEYRLDGVNTSGSPWSFFAVEFGMHY
jgi:hypothetical protein